MTELVTMGRHSAKEVQTYIKHRIAKWKESTGKDFPIEINWEDSDLPWLLEVVCKWGYQACEDEQNRV